MKRIRGLLLVVVVAASTVSGIVALSSPVEAGPSCIIKCVAGVCERCCHQKGGWVCT